VTSTIVETGAPTGALSVLTRVAVTWSRPLAVASAVAVTVRF